MYTDRRIERHQLRDYLQVFNQHNDKLLGCLGNISEEGLMLISSLPLLVGARFDLCLKAPRGEGHRTIDVHATCLWCHEDETPGCYDAGFELTEVSAEYFELIESLRRYFCFYPSMEASA
ncbi:PilZ domain-containing protein [Pseudomonas sp. CDFA 602]|uniref:PilZ domain-containing protein n=1 Tax=Pseudomonas californiensis TaxID=2829823 RepID=UPI001E3EE530|nr:PilZ domain-containing protein [Pseudomonas californiensis]MCD5995223.1 PilZ domain-containing protein [Pseudomonas californiensis]MCD6000691.1 PilZ domain-containing protein [Pseudomonas californiensis]